MKVNKSNIRWYVGGNWLPKGISIIEEDTRWIKKVKTVMIQKDKEINSNIVSNMTVIVEGERGDIKWLEEFLSSKE